MYFEVLFKLFENTQHSFASYSCRGQIKIRCKNQPCKSQAKQTNPSFFIIIMNNQINIIVQNQVFLLPRELLINQSQNKQIKTSKDFTLPFPQWVTKQTYLLIQKYLRTKDVSFLISFINQNETIVKLLRTADYLGLVKFHDKFINEILIPNINHHNCLFLLEESHKKLKNINDSQTWYNLLNMSIIYLSTNAYEVFKLNSKRFKKLNEKIVTQVLERVIRLERKNKFENKHMLYQLIMQCKENQIEDISKIFEVLKANLKAKKIHSKIHAKLSWKLEKIPEMNEKKTKNFKYLDVNWFLKANKIGEDLLVTLNLIPSDFGQQQSEIAQSLASEQINDEKEDAYANDNFTKIGVFYSKVHWKVQDQTFQQEIKIHYLLINESNLMEIIVIDQKMQKQIGMDKVQLTIYCNTETIYTFLINYVLWHYEGVIFKGPSFSYQQLLILIKANKLNGNYSVALRMTTQLVNLYPKSKEDPQVSQGFDFSKMTKVELEIYTNTLGKKVTDNFFTKIKNIDVQSNPSHTESRNSQGQTSKRTISPIPITPINSIYKKGNFSSTAHLNNPSSISSTPASKIEQKQSSFHKTGSGRQNTFNNVDSLTNSRGGSKRKIFSKGESEPVDRKERLFQQAMKITDLSRYLCTDTNRNPEYQKLMSVLKI